MTVPENHELRKTSTISESVRKHYEPEAETSGRTARMVEILNQLPQGKLSTAQLAPLDQLHTTGIMATKQLAGLAEFQPFMKVLDAGSGVGGPARYLSETFGCTVIGVDLTPSLVELANLLSERAGFAECVRFQVGDLMNLPFPDANFDAIWTQHVVMNIADRVAVYREFARVLKPGGKLVFHDLFLPDGKPELTYPLPWAETPATSFLYTKAETIAALARAGFSSGAWHDCTEETIAGLAAQMQSIQQAPPGTLTLAAVMGPRIAELGANAARNAREGRLRAVMGVYELDRATSAGIVK